MNRSQERALAVATGFIGGAALFFVAAAVIDDIAKANTPPASPPYSEEAAEADWALCNGLLALSRNETKPWLLRVRASIGARKYKEYWLDQGNAVCHVDPEFKRRTYGNWCGAGCGAGVPIDEIDELCRQHDWARRRAFARLGLIELPVYA